MKTTGIVRKLDNLGRIVIQIELRQTLGIAIKDGIEIFTEGDQIIMRKYQPGCALCGRPEDNVMIAGKRVCAQCVAEAAAHIRQAARQAG